MVTFSLNGKFGQNGKLGVRVPKGRLYDSQVRDHVIAYLGLNVSSSTHSCWCMVNGGNAMAANLSIIISNIKILVFVIIYIQVI